MKAIHYLFLAITLLTWSCDTEYLDPNSILEPEVTDSEEKLTELINGIQRRWSTERSGMLYTSTSITGLNTGELRLLNPGNLGENEVLLGGDDINGGNELLENMWTTAMLCRKEAVTLYQSADNFSQEEAKLNTFKAYALFFRALSHGTLIQYFEQVPLQIEENAPFSSRDVVLSSVIDDLEEALTFINAGLSSEIQGNTLQSIDLENSVYALLARFYLMNKDYDKSLLSAGKVDLTKSSTWVFDAAIPNPLSFWFGSQNVTQARNLQFTLPDNLSPNPNDERISFYVTAEDLNVPNPNYQVKGFYDDDLKPIPVYLPGEILLIKAECNARNDDLNPAVIELNKVLNKKASDDIYGLGANLPDYSGDLTKEAILDEIYKNRRIELYLTGLGLEDSRRFVRPGPNSTGAERNRNFYPYTNSERDNNTSTPDNPSS